MKVTEKGPGKAEVAVVYCTHGDEVAGKKAVEKLLDEKPDFRKGVKFVFANEKAYEQGERFIDTDLNRSFPGDSESDSYEERLAAEMMQELQEPKVLDLHETRSAPTPFALFTWMDEETMDTLQSTGVDKAVEISYTPGCGINHYGGVEVETGPRGSQESAEMAYQVLKDFLINEGVLAGEANKSRPEIFSVYDVEDRPEGDWNAAVENFQEVSKGETVAKSGSEEILADKSFVPVLFAESYPDIFGFKAVRLEKVEERIYQQEVIKNGN
ncbi:succinylglutamate desuccinylase/aspartoacylase domain-containing protein [Candidatus Nanohalovita haloferacivicina]|uniref:succinylglutamate desuccinylase/aspartoacylase domain-containing protein n=1 Tax=Candidatus Nanohalovita haloferacivicina TaxID=2978046 RepID=UPI00325FBAA0|nr:Succinylglutamate desuccinylase/aspartoacylase [Candidatus Nanohalobia archaeon BNXNv]